MTRWHLTVALLLAALAVALSVAPASDWFDTFVTGSTPVPELWRLSTP